MWWLWLQVQLFSSLIKSKFWFYGGGDGGFGFGESSTLESNFVLLNELDVRSFEMLKGLNLKSDDSNSFCSIGFSTG